MACCVVTGAHVQDGGYLELHFLLVLVVLVWGGVGVQWCVCV